MTTGAEKAGKSANFF